MGQPVIHPADFIVAESVAPYPAESAPPRFFYIFLFLVLCLVPVVISALPLVVQDADLWWHLRTGEWIVAHRAVTTTDPFSTFGAGKPWAAYSWLFELAGYGALRGMGLLGVVALQALVLVVIAGTLFFALQRITRQFMWAFALSAVAMIAMRQSMMPRPWLLTILFSFIEVAMLFDARATGRWRPLLWLIPMFVVWANCHVQFVYGLMMLALAGSEPLLVRGLARLGIDTDNIDPAAVTPVRPLCCITAACAAATLVNPYGPGIYRVIYEYAEQKDVFNYVYELRAPDFRAALSYIMVLLVIAGAYVVGKRPKVELFSALLLIGSAFAAVHTARDSWCAVLLSVLLIARHVAGAPGPVWMPRKLELAGIALAIVVAFFAVVHQRGLSNAVLEQTVADHYPRDAAEFVARQHYPGPLYNDFDWGGYLIWKLHDVPVVMDGRTNLHGPERIAQSAHTWAGLGEWDKDPELGAARLVIAKIPDDPLYNLLRRDSAFDMVYHDRLAAVFIRRQVHPATSSP